MTDLCETPDPTRRRLLVTGGALFGWAFMPRFARAAGGRDPRFVTVILRGAMDGLSAVAPVGDPDYVALRESIALSAGGDRPALPLDGFFALHPAMPNFARLYKQNQALVVHAVASPYRERSHFDGQDVLESGLPGVGRVDSGWMNRLLQVLPKGEKVAAPGRTGLGVGTITPLIMRGGAPVLGWAPQSLPKADEDTAARVLDLYRHRDPVLADALSRGLDTEAMAMRSGLTGDAARPRGGSDSPDGMRQAAAGAARLLAQDTGPRLAALAFDGWDTHANEGGATGRLAQLLGGLDGALAEFETAMGPAWKDTVLLVVTEFGRTARVNGTVGTDHGTATVAFLAGGAVKGGRVLADWPGLKIPQLHEQRDLRPTTDLRAVAKGVLADHLGMPAGLLGEKVFPGTTGVKPVQNLIA
ncbi:MAG: DUF1501 domain-containing protein [Alsobacter sp.]